MIQGYPYDFGNLHIELDVVFPLASGHQLIRDFIGSFWDGWIVAIPILEVFIADRNGNVLPFGKHTKNDGKSPFFMGKSTINGHFQ